MAYKTDYLNGSVRIIKFYKDRVVYRMDGWEKTCSAVIKVDKKDGRKYFLIPMRVYLEEEESK